MFDKKKMDRFIKKVWSEETIEKEAYLGPKPTSVVKLFCESM